MHRPGVAQGRASAPVAVAGCIDMSMFRVRDTAADRWTPGRVWPLGGPTYLGEGSRLTDLRLSLTVPVRKKVALMWTVSVSRKGQLVLPKEVRERLGLAQGGHVSVRVEQGAIVMELAPEARAAWARWRGALRGSNALDELIAEHKAEVDRGD